MLATLSLIRREFSAYFLSPIAYAVLTVFLGVTGYRFYLTVGRLTATGPRGVEYPMQFLFSIMPPGSEGSSITQLLPELLSGLAFWLVFLLIPPLLTMRLFAEERSTGTLEMLMTAPVRDWQVVLSKFLACFAFYVLMWLPTLAYLPVLLGAESALGRVHQSLAADAGLPWVAAQHRLRHLAVASRDRPVARGDDLPRRGASRGDVPGHRLAGQQPGPQPIGGSAGFSGDESIVRCDRAVEGLLVFQRAGSHRRGLRPRPG